MEDLLPLLIQLAVMAVFGAICAALAHARGRSAIGWFFIGLVAPCIGLILVCVLPDLKKQAERDRRARDENRRLRERVKKDRVVADRRHADVSGRLTTHDRALGVDTSRRREAVGPAAEPPPLPGEASGEVDGHAARAFYVGIGSVRRGPMALADLRALWRSGDVDARSLVWFEGLAQWSPIAEVAGLDAELEG